MRGPYEEALQKLQANSKALQSAQGKFAVAASENGVGGLSIAALSSELNANAGHYASDVQYNRDASDEELALQLRGIQSDAQGKLNNIPQPSLLSAAAKVGGDAFNAYHAYMYVDPGKPDGNVGGANNARFFGVM